MNTTKETRARLRKLAELYEWQDDLDFHDDFAELESKFAAEQEVRKNWEGAARKLAQTTTLELDVYRVLLTECGRFIDVATYGPRTVNLLERIRTALEVKP